MAHNRKYRGRRLLIMLLLLLIPAGAAAQERRTVSFHPRIELTAWYDDNVDFLPDRDKEGDWYGVIAPGIEIGLPPTYGGLIAGYTYTRYQYLHRSDLNRDYHHANIAADEIPLIRNIYITGGDQFDTVPIDIGEPEDNSYNLTQRNRAYLRLIWKYDYSARNRIRAAYEPSRVDYTESGNVGQDYWGHLLSSVWEFDISRSLRLIQRNRYYIKDYDNLPLYQRFIPEAGLEIELKKFFTFGGRAGYSFERTSDYHYRGAVYRLYALWRPSEKLQSRISFRRERTSDIEGNPITDDYYQLDWRYLPLKRLAFEGYIRYHDYRLTDSRIKRLYLRAGLAYRLRPEVEVTAGYGRVQTVDAEPDEKAVSNRFFAGLRLAFNPKD